MLRLFKKKRRETDAEIQERLLKLCKKGDYGLCTPPMDAQVAVNELCRYFLGDDWYSVMSMHPEQVNTEIVYEIERIYKKYRKY